MASHFEPKAHRCAWEVRLLIIAIAQQSFIQLVQADIALKKIAQLGKRHQ
jgi:hypothetical protein